MTGPPLVLVVEDSLTVRMDLVEALQEAGFRVRACASLAEARAALREGPCVLAILDLQLPDGEGLDLLELLKGDPARRVPVMVLSSESEVHHRVRGLRTGADEYVGKPYDLTQVIGRARELIGRSARGADPQRSRVLVIDDSPTLRAELQAVLAAAGHEVVAAGSGEEGLRLAATCPPDAVVVDGSLPGIDGPEVIRRLRHDARLRHVPCLLLTGSDGSDQLAALDSGADAYVNKSEGTEVVLLRLGVLLRPGRPRAEQLEPSHLTPKRMLVVDDSATYRHELAGPLRDEGYDVVLAASGEEALELLASQPVDCVILDVMMPGLSGHETCRRIRQAQARDVPVIMNTAHDDGQALIEAINAGADDYIAKSAALEVLKARVRAQLRRKQFEEENRRIRDELTRKEIEATEARAARELAAVLERKNLELQEQNRRVEAATRMKSEFLASMSHELRTPLNAIIGFSELLYDEIAGPVNPTQREYLNDVLTSSRHLLQLIDDVLDLAKVESGKMQFTPVDLDLGLIVREVCDVTRSIAQRKRVQIATTVEPGLEVRLDPGKLKQVLYNYVSNALKFSPEDGVIAIRAGRSGPDRLRIEVEDHGVGISEADQRALWQEFRQVGGGPGKRPQGTGLGLALTRRIVEAQGGQVGVRSAPGEGSTFWAELPRMPRAGTTQAGG